MLKWQFEVLNHCLFLILRFYFQTIIEFKLLFLVVVYINLHYLNFFLYHMPLICFKSYFETVYGDLMKLNSINTASSMIWRESFTEPSEQFIIVTSSIKLNQWGTHHLQDVPFDTQMYEGVLQNHWITMKAVLHLLLVLNTQHELNLSREAHVSLMAERCILFFAKPPDDRDLPTILVHPILVALVTAPLQMHNYLNARQQYVPLTQCSCQKNPFFPFLAGAVSVFYISNGIQVMLITSQSCKVI